MACGDNTNGCGGITTNKLLSIEGLQRILDTIAGKLFTMWGALQAKGTAPLHLDKETGGAGETIINGYIDPATAEQDGYMSAEDKRRLDELYTQAQPTFGEITVELEYPMLPAEGGSVSPIYSYSQKWSAGNGMGGEITTGATLRFEWVDDTGVVPAAIDGLSLDNYTGVIDYTKENTAVDGDLALGKVKLTVTLNGKSGEATADVGQKGKEAVTTYETPVVSLYYPSLTSNNRTIVPTYAYSQKWSSTNGTSGSITSGGELVFTAKGSTEGDDGNAPLPSGFSIDEQTGVVTYTGSGTTGDNESIDLANVTLTVTMNGESGSATALVVMEG